MHKMMMTNANRKKKLSCNQVSLSVLETDNHIFAFIIVIAYRESTGIFFLLLEAFLSKWRLVL